MIPGSFTRQRIFYCTECGCLIADQIICMRGERGFDWMNCPVCDMHISLSDPSEHGRMELPQPVVEMERMADSRRDVEASITSLQGKRATRDFGVYLCYSEADKSFVEKISEQLQQKGILPWLGERDLRPGFPRQRLIEEQIPNIKSAAIFVGKNGIGPWQQVELEAFLREFVQRGCPVIPILLKGAPPLSKLPVFLQGMTWIDFTTATSHPLDSLIWGITGERPVGM